MSRKRVDVKCPYCGNVFAASGMTAHVRHKHPGDYEGFKADRAAIIEKNTVVEGAPEPTPTPEPATEPAPEPTPTPEPGDEPPAEPAQKKQKGAGFLGDLVASLRTW